MNNIVPTDKFIINSEFICIIFIILFSCGKFMNNIVPIKKTNNLTYIIFLSLFSNVTLAVIQIFLIRPVSLSSYLLELIECSIN